MDVRLLDGWESTGVRFRSDQQNGETDWNSIGPSLRLGHALVSSTRIFLGAKNYGWHVEQAI